MDKNRSTEIYQLRIAIREISPAIWRRVLVRSDSTIKDLHYTIQISMGWTDTHLNRFIIHGTEFGVYHSGGMTFSDDPAEVQLSRFRFRQRERFLYEYDFGDAWQHQIRLEHRLPLDSKRTYPICIDGKRACPPEDCGGAWAFLEQEQYYSPSFIIDRLSAIAYDEDDDDGDIEDYRDELDVFCQWLNKELFDRHAVNRALKQYALGDKRWMLALSDQEAWNENHSSA